jgi:uncharacterized protein YihD (DUF1040 family)
MNHKKLIHEAQEVLDDLYPIVQKLKKLELEGCVKKVNDIIDDIALYQVKVQDDYNERI